MPTAQWSIRAGCSGRSIRAVHSHRGGARTRPRGSTGPTTIRRPREGCRSRGRPGARTARPGRGRFATRSRANATDVHDHPLRIRPAGHCSDSDGAKARSPRKPSPCRPARVPGRERIADDAAGGRSPREKRRRDCSQRTVTVIGAEVVALPARSVATALNTCDPFVLFFVFHAVCHGELVTVPRSTPSR